MELKEKNLRDSLELKRHAAERKPYNSRQTIEYSDRFRC